ncbi:ATP-grasp fold amidoligase family protein [Roseibium sp.]|uniref:ATP-grasp fold amidoligase family protein n=1 Tax=Roseibium sp. TaxID=1936156 RepID=UPI003B51AB5C
MSRHHLVKSHPMLGYFFRPWIISNLYEGLCFLLKHRRWPNFKKTGYINDLVFRIRAMESDYVFRSFTSDKEFSKIFIRGVTGEDVCVPTLAVLHTAEDVDQFAFPDNCVIKPTHMSNEFVFHTSGPVPDEARERMRRWFKMNFADMTGENNYKRLQPKIIVEPWLELNGQFAHDFRFHMYNGNVAWIGLRVRVSTDKEISYQLTPDWHLKDGPGIETEAASIDIAALRPKQIARMIDIAEQIARFADYVRVDFFTDGEDQLFVGEISHIYAGARKVFKHVASEQIESRPVRPGEHDTQSTTVTPNEC